MSYFAEGLMRKQGIEPTTGKTLEIDTPSETAVTPAASVAATPAEPDPRSFSYEAPAGAEDPTTAIGKERQRFATAGVSQNEAYRLLGGPRQKIGA